MALDRPIPILATGTPTDATITFDRPLVTGPLDPANWRISRNNQVFTMASADVVPARPANVKLIYNFPPTNLPGPDTVGYSPPPFDVLSAVGQVPAAAFSGFPLT